MSDLENMSDVMGGDYFIGDVAARDAVRTLPAWKKLSPQEQKKIEDFLLKAEPNPNWKQNFAEIKAMSPAEQLAALKEVAQFDEQKFKQQIQQALEQGVSTQVDFSKVDFSKTKPTATTEAKPTTKAADWLKAPAWKEGPARWKIGAGVGVGGVVMAFLGTFLKRR
jgi:hypothetical protein